MKNLEQLIIYSKPLAGLKACCEFKKLTPVCILQYSKYEENRLKTSYITIGDFSTYIKPSKEELFAEAYIGIIAEQGEEQVFFVSKYYHLDIESELQKFNDEGFGELRELYELEEFVQKPYDLAI